MFIYYTKRKLGLSFRVMVAFIITSFAFGLIQPIPNANAQSVLNLPHVGSRVSLSSAYNPAIIRGITIYPDNPLRFDFIVDRGDDFLEGEELKEEGLRMIKYFLASITVPEDELWVNLSPYEEDRIVPDALGVTEMGRDLLAQDYLLKQLTASMMYPENELGEQFWNRVEKKAKELYGTFEIPINTFNRVWIVPKNAVVYESGLSAFVSNSHLTVMLDKDYLTLQQNLGNTDIGTNELENDDVHIISDVTSEIIREVLIPEIEKEVNEGEHFARLRQIYNSMILAMWYKKNLRETLLNQVYADKNKIKGIDLEDKQIKQKIYDQYIEAFKKGVYSFIREDFDADTQQVIPRKFFSGGAVRPESLTVHKDRSRLAPGNEVPTGPEIGKLAVLGMAGYELGGNADIDAATKKKSKGSAADFLNKLMLSENEQYLKRFLSEEGVSYQDILAFRKPYALESSVKNELKIMMATIFEKISRNGQSYYRFRDNIRQVRPALSLDEIRDFLTNVNNIDFGTDPATRVGVTGETKPFNRGNPMNDLRPGQVEQLQAEVGSLISALQQRVSEVAPKTQFVRENVQIIVDWLAEKDELPEDYNLVWLAGSKFESSVQEVANLYRQKRTKVLITGGIGKDSATILELKENFGLTQEIEAILNQVLDDLVSIRTDQNEASMWETIEQRFNIRLGRDKRIAEKKRAGDLSPGYPEWIIFYKNFIKQNGITDPMVDLVNQEGQITSEEHMFNRLLDKETRYNTLLPEALYYYAYLLSSGVAAEDIYVDAQSTNALENAGYGASILQRAQDFEAHNIVVVQFPETARRSKATLQKQLPLEGNYPRWDTDQYQIYVSAPQIYKDGEILRNMDPDELEDMKQYVMGEVDRFPLYHENGSIVKVDIPDEVKQAYDRLNEDDDDPTPGSGSDPSPGAASADQREFGGIDLNPAFLDLQLKRDPNGIPLPMSQQPIYNINIQGILPVIINIRPATPLILGLAS